ncbi:3-deoxy-D-manno-octulosonic acid transferase [Afifella sp. IM 167]|uniref:3-deoxy-D-manno-octulosonic acid transferase n=1 Tax=Afifella sp. IM 167 TaxID=2033586 RepID=UPI001CC9FFE0|nr:3-deoxy-D-manno-octulosonic acid transferase [Afifella sp. IM 167]MBZ8133463.1 3-deoxy-D-manno-octulosonic acid transferase [Afifella sp. IM 167]
MAEVWDRFAISIWRSAGHVIQPAVSLLLKERERRGKEESERIAERRGHASRKRPAGRLAWVHAASVGETNSVLPLIAGLQKKGMSIVLTTGTVTSAAIASRRLRNGAVHQYVPLDLPLFCRRFLQHWQPDLAVFVESELWPTAMDELYRRSVPLVLVNGRMSERSFRRWRQSGPFGRSIMRRINLCLAQSEADAERFGALGVGKVVVTGNLKFDAPEPAAPAAELAAFRAAIGRRPVFLAASLHPGEDEIVLAAAAGLRAAHPDLLTIIAPRHPERAPQILDLAAAAGIAIRSRSAGQMPEAETGIFLADTIGEMGIWYRLADIAFLGGTLVEHGGQNPIEPAKLAVPVLHGPHTDNFSEIFAALVDAQATIEVTGAEDLASEAAALLADPAERERLAAAAADCVAGSAGALQKSLEALAPYLAEEPETEPVGG